MFAITSSLFAVALAAAPATAIADWLPASGTGSCSMTSVDFSDALHGFAAGDFNCGVVTADGGLTWSPIRVMPQQGQSLVWAHAASVDELYAARLGLYRSTDGGQTWAELGTLSSQNGSIFDVRLIDAEHMVAIKGGQIRRSVDGGQTWDTPYPGKQDINFHELHFPTAKTGYATGGVVRGMASAGTVLRSTDGGENWDLLPFGHGRINAAAFLDAEHGMVATYREGIWTTSDGTDTWEPVASAPPGSINQLKYRDELTWYATTTDGCVYTTHDAGNTWQQGYCDTQFRPLASLSLRGGMPVAVGNEGLAVYEDRLFRDGFDGR